MCSSCLSQRYGSRAIGMISSIVVLLAISWCSLHAQKPIRSPLSPPPQAPSPAKQMASIQGSTLPIAPPCTGCYQGFSFDTVFRMGAHFNGSWPGAPQFLKDSLHIGITQLYGQPYLHEFFRPEDIGDGRKQWFDSLRRENWRSIRSADLKVILQPGSVSAIAKGSEMSEAYFGQTSSDTIQRLVFSDMGQESAIDRPLNSFIWGGVFPRSESPAPPLLMAGGPYWTAMGIAQNGYYLPSQSSETGKYDVAVTMKVANNENFEALDPDSLIAFVKIYRRIPVGQDICGCNLYEYVDMFNITKAVYLDTAKSDTTVGSLINPYRDVTYSFRINEPSLQINAPLKVVLGPGDTITALVPGTYPKYVPRGGAVDGHPLGNYPANPHDTAPRLNRYCGRLRDALVANSYYNAAMVFDRPEIIKAGDFGYEVYTTRKVDITFLRGRLAPHTYALLRRGAFDDDIQASINAVFDDTTLGNAMNTQLFRFGVVDEHAIEKYRGYMDVAARVQRAILERDSNDRRGIWANPQSGASSFRILSGDLDSTAIRMVHMMANQWYNYGGFIPVAYANPDSMNGSAALTSGLYRAMDDSISGARRSILYNTSGDYRSYTKQTLEATTTTINSLAQMTNAARFMFRHIRRESYPVYSVVQVHGFLNASYDNNGNATGYDRTWFFPIVTPEEITVQSWLTLNCGMDGMWFSDFTYDDAREFGVMHWLTGDHSSNYQDSLYSGDETKKNIPQWRLPKMWTGFKDRFNAVKRVADDFHRNIIPVYQKLDRNGIRMNIWIDSGFAVMPMIDTLFAVRAQRLKWGGSYQAMINTSTESPVADPLDSTYMVATIFSPGPADTNRLSRYLVLTNLRCWPYDEKRYSSYVGTFHENDSFGLGAIDARMPVVVLKNSTGVIADSARLQRIGDTASRTVAFGTQIELDWLDPGWGAMYMITPIIRPVSALGTAYNNAVHSLNPSLDGGAHDRLFVYERDSAVYLRALDSTGGWGSEHLISLASDTATVIVGGKQRNAADNMFPAIDMIRSDGTSCAIVWERHDTQTDLVTVEMAWLPFKPTRTSFPSDGNIVRRRLLAPRKFEGSWMQLTPAITGVDSGYIVAWAAPDYTVEVIAVRDNPSHGRVDTSRSLRLKMIRTSAQPNPVQPDSATAYPTLAYVRNWQWIAMNEGLLSGPDDDTAFITMPPYLPGVPTTVGSFHMAHLAYAQGRRDAPHAFSVMYNRIGVTFPPLVEPVQSSPIPRLWASPTEEVSNEITGCERTYPSIAADSVRVAVTFTVNTGRSYVYLRFRDNDQTTQRKWNTPAYVWGSQAGRTPRFRDYERSSATMFPARDTMALRNSYEGALAWQWTNPGDDRHNGVKFYRFGSFAAETLPDGQHPTMMLVPGIGEAATHAMRASGIFRRGADADQFQERRGRGDTGVYYPGYFDNTPVSPLLAFSGPVPADTITAEGTVKKPVSFFSGCETTGGAITTGLQLNPRLDTLPGSGGGGPGQPWDRLGMPPSFFPSASVGSVPITSAGDLDAITRTPTFTADSSTVTITRTAVGNGSLLSWLNTEPNDPVTGEPANIFYSMQVVRDSDNVVLWAGDTISARTVAADTVADEITIPLGSLAIPGTRVHIRLATTTTMGLDCSVQGGFSFGGSAGAPAAKRIISNDTRASLGERDAIAVRMIPNPLHAASGELRVSIPAPGSASVAIYDMLGNQVLVLPMIEAKQGGEYAVPVDLSGLGNGLYVVDVRSGHGRGSARITVVR